jgi:hypothetical protein
MKQRTGVWLDKEKALVIILSENDHKLKTIESDISNRDRFEGERKEYGRFGGQFLSMENKKKNRIKKQSLEYLKRIISVIKNSDEIVLFGPAEMKTDLEKLILKDNNLKDRLVGVETADSMTENQMVAWVKEFYN